jgi:hypothetical protein
MRRYDSGGYDKTRESSPLVRFLVTQCVDALSDLTKRSCTRRQYDMPSGSQRKKWFNNCDILDVIQDQEPLRVETQLAHDGLDNALCLLGVPFRQLEDGGDAYKFSRECHQ